MSFGKSERLFHGFLFLNYSLTKNRSLDCYLWNFLSFIFLFFRVNIIFYYMFGFMIPDLTFGFRLTSIFLSNFHFPFDFLFKSVALIQAGFCDILIRFGVSTCIFLFTGFVKLNWLLVIWNQVNCGLDSCFFVFLNFVLKRSIFITSWKVHGCLLWPKLNLVNCWLEITVMNWFKDFFLV